MGDEFPVGYSRVLRFEGSLLYLYNWNGDTQSYDRSQIDGDRIFCYLSDSLEVMEGTTLGHIFDFVANLDHLKEFLAQYSGCPQIIEFHNQSMLPEERETDIEYLEVYQQAEIHTWKKSEPTQFSIEVGFHGIGPAPADEEIYKPGETIKYSVSYSPMNRLVYLPIRINKHCKVLVMKKFNIEQQYETIRPITLLEFLNAIYWDISFVGGPEENAAFIEDLQQTVEDIKEGRIETFPLELGEDDDDEDLECSEG